MKICMKPKPDQRKSVYIRVIRVQSNDGFFPLSKEISNLLLTIFAI